MNLLYLKEELDNIYHTLKDSVDIELDAVHDKAYFNGFRAGWNAGLGNDVDALESMKRSYKP